MPPTQTRIDIADRFKVVDVDTHLFEPDDVWTARVSKKFGDRVPHVKRDPETQNEYWYSGDIILTGGIRGGTAGAVGTAQPPAYPRNIDEVDPSAWDAKARLAKMDEFGIHAQVLYPNIGFFSKGFARLEEPELMRQCVRAYNDFLVDWCSEDPKRLVPLMLIPFWDDADVFVDEIRRSAARGHKGIVFCNQMDSYNLPPLAHPRWNPLWEVAQDEGLSVNFHIGAGDKETAKRRDYEGNGPMANNVRRVVMEFMDNARTIADLIVSGICQRYPRLNFVSVESGVGYVPYLLEALDWQWSNAGAMLEHPEFDLLPSEYFRRQIYACFWFERATLPTALHLYPDNMLYETDFPHSTSQTPGPATPLAVSPREYIERSLGALPESTLRNVLHDNAARVYRLEN